MIWTSRLGTVDSKFQFVQLGLLTDGIFDDTPAVPGPSTTGIAAIQAAMLVAVSR